MGDKFIGVQLVDDHAIVRAGLRQLLDRESGIGVVAESAGGKQAMKDYELFRPDIVVMDISLPDISGLEAMRRILQRHPRARILVLSMHAGLVAERAMQMGACGFICKRSGVQDLVAAINEISRGGRYVDPTSKEQPSGSGPEPLASLSKRELEICMLLVEGRSVVEIAGQLHLSDKTVYTHRKRIVDKLGVSTDVELMQLAGRLGIG